MNLRFTEEDEAFRREVAEWLAANLRGEFAVVRGRGGPGDEHACSTNGSPGSATGAAGWTCVGWPRSTGGAGSAQPSR
jgi:alkylation response protein AidB-like acyl-CoA dehydrogenase